MPVKILDTIPLIKNAARLLPASCTARLFAELGARITSAADNRLTAGTSWPRIEMSDFSTSHLTGIQWKSIAK